MYYRNITIIHRGDFVARFKLDRNTISEKNNKELSVDFLKSANEELICLLYTSDAADEL